MTDPVRSGLLWDCYVELSNWCSTYNGNPTRFREAEARTGDALGKLLDRLEAHFYPDEEEWHGA